MRACFGSDIGAKNKIEQYVKQIVEQLINLLSGLHDLSFLCTLAPGRYPGHYLYLKSLTIVAADGMENDN